MSSITADLNDPASSSSLPILPRIKAPPPQPSTAKSSENSKDCNGMDDGCHTPTSDDHRIPPQLTCPPAPRKPNRKRRAPESEADNDLLLKKAVTTEEIEAFFVSCELNPAAAFGVGAKRTCCSCK